MSEPPQGLPEKQGNLKRALIDHLNQGLYFPHPHLYARMRKREIDEIEILQVLRSGRHERKKDEFDYERHCWKYAIRGHTREGREMRVIVFFDNELGVVLLTAIDDL